MFADAYAANEMFGIMLGNPHLDGPSKPDNLGW
jgi:hypothetical protein